MLNRGEFISQKGRRNISIWCLEQFRKLSPPLFEKFISLFVVSCWSGMLLFDTVADGSYLILLANGYYLILKLMAIN